MGFQSFASIGRRADRNMHWQYIYKPTTPVAGTAGYFIDLNQSAGIPKYNPFAGTALAANQLIGAGNFGIYPGTFEPGSSKHVLSFQMSQRTVTSGPPDFVYLLDYLTFYPLIDTDDPSAQDMENIQTLPRYTTGDGVRIVLIVQAPLVTTASIAITYTNSDGTAGRVSTANIIPGLSIGVCATGSGTLGGPGQATPFFPLASSDKGVRSIESVTMTGSGGGFICAALVKPICEIVLYEAFIPTEKQFGIFGQNPPEVFEGCCLNLMISRGATNSGNYRGEILFVNS